MARTTITQVTDDLDGSKDAQEVTFSWDGADYVIDLSKKNRQAFEKAITPYLQAARRTPARSSARHSTSKSSSRRDLGKVREWAAAHGVAVSARGRISKAVLDQYDAAQH